MDRFPNNAKIDFGKLKRKHGGARKGSGRKKKEPTVVMRVPKSLVSKVEKMIENHRRKSLPSK
jgi:hypothetical protein